MRARCTRGAWLRCVLRCMVALHARCMRSLPMRRPQRRAPCTMDTLLSCPEGCPLSRGVVPQRRAAALVLGFPPRRRPAWRSAKRPGGAKRTGSKGQAAARLESRPLERLRVRKHRRRDRRRAAPRREQRLQQLRQRFVPRVRANRLPPQPPPYSTQPPPAARVACVLQLALEQRGHERRVVPLHLARARVRPGCTGLQPGYAAAGTACRATATAASVDRPGPCRRPPPSSQRSLPPQRGAPPRRSLRRPLAPPPPSSSHRPLRLAPHTAGRRSSSAAKAAVLAPLHTAGVPRPGRRAPWQRA